MITACYDQESGGETGDAGGQALSPIGDDNAVSVPDQAFVQ